MKIDPNETLKGIVQLRNLGGLVKKPFDEKVNSKLANHFVKTAHALFSANHLNLKVHNVNTINNYNIINYSNNINKNL